MDRPFLREGLVSGHFGPAPVSELPATTVRVTVLRDPVARVILHYRHIRREPGHYFHAHVNERGYTFSHFIKDSLCRTLVENHQARHLALEVDRPWPERNARRDVAPLTPVQAGYELAESGIKPSDLRRIAAHTLAIFDIVGTTEQLDSLLAQVASSVGVTSHGGVGVFNAARDAIDIELSSADERLLHELTAVDAHLYEIARGRGDQGVATRVSPGHAASRPAPPPPIEANLPDELRKRQPR